MDLRSKLALYKENCEKTRTAQAQEKMPENQEGIGHRAFGCTNNAGLDVHDIMPGTVQNNENGSCYLVENRYPLSWLYGGFHLGDAAGSDCDVIEALGGASCKGLKANELLYLDTETTGLSGGTGTVAFLVGAGFFDNGAFVVRQYFMRDYDEEEAMLTELQTLFGRFRGFVTFNGKAFDINLLQNRFVTNRLKADIVSKPNLDLLYPSRKVWGLKLESCRLVSLEENVLGELRVDDIPGSMIPSVYFKYLEDRDASVIKKVIKHNEMDILSMTALLAKLSDMLRNPPACSGGGYELLGLGRIFELSGDTESMVGCLEACTNSEAYAVRAKAVRRLTDIYKRNGSYDLALRHWNELEHAGGIDIFHLVEIAKYYEHKQNNPEYALAVVEKAMQRCREAGLAGARQYLELAKRRERLRKKKMKHITEI